MRQEVDSRDEVMHRRNERLVILIEEDVGGRERLTTDEERVRSTYEGAEQRSGCADKKVEQWQEFYGKPLILYERL